MTGPVDVLVIGAGPAGLSAARAAAQSGAQVLLIDSNPGLGGQIWRGATGQQRGAAGDLYRAVKLDPRISILTGAQVVTVEPGGVRVSARSGARLIRPGKVILATGASERFVPFPGWTLPNVVGAGGLQAMVKAGLDIAGKRVVIAGSGPLLLAVAAELRERGAQVLLVAEQAPLRRLARFAPHVLGTLGKARQAAQLGWALRQVPYLASTYPVEAHGQERVERVTLRRHHTTWTLDCDFLAVGFGLVPDVRVALAFGCRLGDDGAVTVNAHQETSVPGVFAAGEVTGVAGVDKALAEGFVAGCAATRQLERAQPHLAEVRAGREFQRALERTFVLSAALRHLPRPDTIVCRCEDVRHAVLESHVCWTEAKLHTRCGMGACQGRICGPAVEMLYGWQATSLRPPLTPVPIADLLDGGPERPAEPLTSPEHTKPSSPSL